MVGGWVGGGRARGEQGGEQEVHGGARLAWQRRATICAAVATAQPQQQRPSPPAPRPGAPAHLQGHGEVVRELGGEEELGLAAHGAAGRRAAQLDDVRLGGDGAVLQRLLGKRDQRGGPVAAGQLRGGSGSGARG